MPTIRTPHSYPACAQHAPDGRLLPLARRALRLMAAPFWDLGKNLGRGSHLSRTAQAGRSHKAIRPVWSPQARP
jgi:hypothetical protein